MISTIPTKRRRGAQPGNQNAKGNKGNPNPRRNLANRGGKGAPRGNHYASKSLRSASAILFDDYKNNSEARAWIDQHRALLDTLQICDEKLIDRATRDGSRGLTLENVAERGLEFRLGLYSRNSNSESFEADIAA